MNTRQTAVQRTTPNPEDGRPKCPKEAWSVDVQCDTCQSNILSAFPKVAWTKSGFHVYCGLDKIR